MRVLCSIFILLLMQLAARGQSREPVDSLLVLPDTLQPFTMDDYLRVILKNHPVAKQAELLSEVARQEIRLARGNFDPKLELGFREKTYNDEGYYSQLNGSLKIPTRSLVNPFVGVDRNSGPYLNPENYISNEYNYRQLNAGVAISLGRGLLTDERRTALKQAELFKEMTEAEQLKIINKLLLEAAKDYWEWYFSFYSYRLLRRSVALATDIYERVKVDYSFGEAASIDTVQARITLQQRLLERQEAWLHYQNAGITLANALWDDSGDPVALNPKWGPVKDEFAQLVSRQELDELMARAMANHPELRKIDVKLRQIEVDRQLAVEFLKPQLDLNYYALNQPLNPEGGTQFNPMGSYKLGVDFSIPIFLRKERSKLALAKLKLTNTQFEQTIAQRQVANELQTTYNKLVNLHSVLTTQFSMVKNYDLLLKAELLNLAEGESDLFKINIQQEKLIFAQTKWLKLLADFEKQRAYLYWAAGTRHLD